MGGGAGRQSPRLAEREQVSIRQDEDVTDIEIGVRARRSPQLVTGIDRERSDLSTARVDDVGRAGGARAGTGAPHERVVRGDGDCVGQVPRRLCPGDRAVLIIDVRLERSELACEPPTLRIRSERKTTCSRFQPSPGTPSVATRAESHRGRCCSDMEVRRAVRGHGWRHGAQPGPGAGDSGSNTDWPVGLSARSVVICPSRSVP